MNGAGHEPRQGGKIVQALPVDQHFDVGGGQTEATRSAPRPSRRRPRAFPPRSAARATRGRTAPRCRFVRPARRRSAGRPRRAPRRIRGGRRCRCRRSRTCRVPTAAVARGTRRASDPSTRRTPPWVLVYTPARLSTAAMFSAAGLRVPLFDLVHDVDDGGGDRRGHPLARGPAPRRGRSCSRSRSAGPWSTSWAIEARQLRPDADVGVSMRVERLPGLAAVGVGPALGGLAVELRDRVARGPDPRGRTRRPGEW